MGREAPLNNPSPDAYFLVIHRPFIEKPSPPDLFLGLIIVIFRRTFAE
jgi:hypothetical protein